MSVAFGKLDKFVLNLGSKAINLASDQLKLALTNDALASTIEAIGSVTNQIPTTNMSGTTTALDLTTTSFTQTSGTAKLIIADLTITATGAVGPFQYIYLYDYAATGHELIGVYNYGSAVTLAAGDTFKVDFDGSAGVLTLA
jgi:hypothetical protein